MQFFGILTTLFFASAAMAACPNGPYPTGSGCGGDCNGKTRCGDNNHVIQCQNGRWTAVVACGHCKGGACV
ncbi:hypothetical protein BDV96DRAFT_578469 [Lophiotrema nucula]|uniref:Uncharacterized protein n=1 Tax=Lophiotrema nucula TaxID=690887 RepID=A0A6A5Z472_9PLEO|nr:hypothetical protein BDV96DRAFT_578469 [Lophiotrema nucula]